MRKLNVLIVIILIGIILAGCGSKPKIDHVVGDYTDEELDALFSGEITEEELKAQKEKLNPTEVKQEEVKEEPEEEIKEEPKEEVLTKGTLVGSGTQGVSILDFGKDKDGRVFVEYIVETFGEATNEYQEQIRFSNSEIKINEKETHALSGHWSLTHSSWPKAIVGTKAVQREVYDGEFDEELKTVEVKVLNNSFMIPITTGKGTISLDGEMPKIGREYNIGEEVPMKDSHGKDYSFKIDGIKRFETGKTEYLGDIDRQGIIDKYGETKGLDYQVFEVDYTVKNINCIATVTMYAEDFDVIDDKGFYGECNMLTQMEFPEWAKTGEEQSGKLFIVTLNDTDKILLRVKNHKSDEYVEDLIIDISNL